MERISKEEAMTICNEWQVCKGDRFYRLDDGRIVNDCGYICYNPNGYICLIEISPVDVDKVEEVVAYGYVTGSNIDSIKMDAKDSITALCKKFGVKAGEICVSASITKGDDYFDLDTACAIWDGEKLKWEVDVTV